MTVVRACLGKTIGVTALLVVMTGCNTTPPPPPASEAEQSAGVKRFVTCLYRNVAKVDDRVAAVYEASLSRVSVVSFAGSGHQIPLDEPERYAKVVGAFLSALDGE